MLLRWRGSLKDPGKQRCGGLWVRGEIHAVVLFKGSVGSRGLWRKDGLLRAMEEPSCLSHSLHQMESLGSLRNKVSLLLLRHSSVRQVGTPTPWLLLGMLLVDSIVPHLAQARSPAAGSPSTALQPELSAAGAPH